MREFQVDNRRENLIIPHYTALNVFVSRPGDLSDEARLRELYRMVSELETFPESWGPKSTLLFLNDFLPYERDSAHNRPDALESDEDDDIEANESGERSIRNDTQLIVVGKNDRATSAQKLLGQKLYFDVNELPQFLQWPEFSYWKGFMRLQTEK